MNKVLGRPPALGHTGFTLIEVLIALLLLTIGILAAGTMQISALQGNSNAKQLSLAVVSGGDRLEELMGKGYEDEDLEHKKDTSKAVEGLDYTDISGKPADQVLVKDNYTVFWNVADDYPIVGCKTIRVLVRRNDHGILKTTSMDFIKMRSI